MDKAQNNESQDKQTERAADSPLKKPETETAHANTGDVAAAAAQNQAGPRQGDDSRRTPRDQGGPISELNVTHHAIDVLNDDSLDDTVDADAKSHDAAKDEFLIEENPNAFVGVNASLVNAHFEQGDGLGGFDSRPARNGLALKLERGFSVVDKGMIAPDAEAVERQYDFVDRDARGDTLRGRKHYAVNHVRPSRLIEIQRRDKA